MKPTYTVNPPHHQPQWPASNDKPEPSKFIFWVGIAFFGLLLAAVSALGLFSMTGKP